MSCIRWALLIEVIGFLLASASVFLKIGLIKRFADWLNDRLVRAGRWYSRLGERYEAKIRESPSKLFDNALVEAATSYWYWLLFGGVIVVAIFSCVWLCVALISRIRRVILLLRRRERGESRIKSMQDDVGDVVVIGALLTQAGIWSLVYVILFKNVESLLTHLESMLVFVTSRLLGRITDWCILAGTTMVAVGLILEFLFTS